MCCARSGTGRRVDDGGGLLEYGDPVDDGGGRARATIYIRARIRFPATRRPSPSGRDAAREVAVDIGGERK